MEYGEESADKIVSNSSIRYAGLQFYTADLQDLIRIE